MENLESLNLNKMSTILPDSDPSSDENDQQSSDYTSQFSILACKGDSDSMSDLESNNTQDNYTLNNEISDQLPLDIQLRAENIVNNLMPVKSKSKYETAYQKFLNWLSEKKITCISDTVVLAYFDQLSESYAPSSLWATYLMLRSMIHIKHNIKIHDYAKLIQFFKNNSKGYISKKALVLSAEHINQLLKTAPNELYLAVKVFLIFGVQGALRKHELTDLTIDDVIDKQDMVLVNIPKTKTQVPKSFVVNKDFYYIYKKYVDLRPADCRCNRFFFNYRNGKCNKQPIGINTIGSMPKMVAKYLQLKDQESYTGHTFRRTSATLLANSGADLLTLKCHGGWKSSTVAEGYVEDSVTNKAKIAEKIPASVLHCSSSSTSKENIPAASQCNSNTKNLKFDKPKEIQNKKVTLGTDCNGKTVNLQISNCNNLTIKFEDHRS